LTIARQFEAKNVRVISQENQGAAAARNKAFSLSQGEYIQWLDADDLLASDKVARQLEVADQTGNRRVLLSSAWGRFMYRYSRARFLPTALWCDLSPVEWLMRKMGQNLYMQTATWLISRELTEAAGRWNTSLLGDDYGEYFCRVLMQGDGVRFVEAAKVYYREAGSKSLSYIGRSDRKMEAQLHSMQLHVAYLRSLEDSERVRNVCVQYLQNWLINFYATRPDIVKNLEQMARDLGHGLNVPTLSWKYAWIRAVFGWSLAHRAQLSLPSIRWSLARYCDTALFHFQNRAARSWQI